MAKIQYGAPTAAGSDAPSLIAERPQLPYLIPFLTFMIFMLPSGFGHFGGIDWKDRCFEFLPFIYAAKTIAAAIMLAIFWRYYTKIRWTHIPLGIFVGLLGLVEWIGVNYASQKLGISSPPAATDIYDPMIRLPNPMYRYIFYFIRVAGPTLVVPVMEELLWRDFFWRAFIRGSRFQEVAIGTFSWVSLLGVSAMFAIAHFQLASGFGYGILMGLLLIRTKSLGSCMVAHGVTNLTLYLYVIHTGDYQFW
jgi:CAAX prenyl protease-like protein